MVEPANEDRGGQPVINKTNGVGGAAKMSKEGLDPVTFEVIKNALMNVADLMGEQILRTCHSMVFYAGDYSSTLCDRHGDTVTQGSHDFYAAMGNMHFHAKAVLDAFKDDIREGDIYAINDPYLGSTHFNDVRLVRPLFWEGEMIALVVTGGHWADIGGTVPGSLDATLSEYYGEGLRIPPVRIWGAGEYRADTVRLIISNTRSPDDAEGDIQACAEATMVAERELTRLIKKYGLQMVMLAFGEIQNYVERLARARIKELPDGEWESVDYLDQEPGAEEGMLPVCVKMTITGDQIHYDLTGSHPAVKSNYNATFGASYSAVVGTTKFLFPDIPLNAGFFRAVSFDPGPEGTVVNARPPTAVGSMGMPSEKLISATLAIWARLVPERAMACSFNIEYLELGASVHSDGVDKYFMMMDWVAGGWGGRYGRDGVNATCPVFAASLTTQPIEAQERIFPIHVDHCMIVTDSGGPGEYRGGCGVSKAFQLRDAKDAIVSYVCDRERSIVWGLEGGLSAGPHGMSVTHEETSNYLGTIVSGVRLSADDGLIRASSGGGGLGDPLLRETQAVLDDVIDDYVSIERAAKDYGVVIEEIDARRGDYRVNEDATILQRERLRNERQSRFVEDPESIAERFRNGDLDVLDLVRHYGVIVDWGNGVLLPRTTATYRELLIDRAKGADK
ncbi:MAG: N-methylhydantoinase B [Planctomycetota bacterium]